MGRIIVANDDGPGSRGLRKLVEALRTVGPVLAVVPEEPVGGRGKSITLLKPVGLRKEGPDFYVASGTPADAFLIALELLGDEEPDLAVSGINMGPNVGIEDFFHSGTLGVAIQAAIHGIPAIAVSYAIGEGFPRPTKEQMEADLRLAAELATELAKVVLTEGMPDGVDLISVNVPVGADRSRVALTELYRSPYWKAVRENGAFYVRPWHRRKPSGPEGTDIWALANGYISITPISLSLGHDLSALKAFLEEAGVLSP